MSTINCYEPDFVRAFLAHNPDSPLHVQMTWQHEIRQSLALTDIASCTAALGDANAFVLHVTQSDCNSQSALLSPRDRVLNQAALNAVTIAGLTPDLRLYALGIMLSWSEKLPGDDADTLAKIASQPNVLADYAATGKLQNQFSRLPALPQLQCHLLSLMGGLTFDWEILPESPRKMTLPLQLSLLMMQDANSEALLLQQLQKQWHNAHQQYFAEEAWIFSNYLIYRLYHDTFPQHESASITQRLFELVTDFYLIRTLLSLWTLDGSPLSQADIFALFTLLERWRHSEESASVRQQVQAILPADYLLSAFSLLIC
ncbi:lysine-N-methylase [Citrobacter freundii]|uniref:lysine-N-methylase n=1 Tax=Citrobacter freundii TaxID=546 RepID=UPI0015E9BBF0|nr:lysine-N-methylase [Citrobacter freundii]QMG42327.1 lysine-N-methylase [Citrobacter freundii]QMR46620.1 lysine-N-methylase [Citrobacter freundii]